jgi:hypothetical protein
MIPTNVLIQSTAIDLLQAIVSRGEIDPPSLQNVQSAVIGEMYLSIHTQRLELQNKLLHLLHSIISVMTTSQDPRSLRSAKVAVTDTSMESSVHDRPEDFHTVLVNPLLLQTLVDGISLPSNSAVLQHWLDFILIVVLQFHRTLQALVPPLGDCICKNLRTRLDDIRKVLVEDCDHDFRSNTTDAEFIMLLNALERLVLLSLPTTDGGHAEEDDVPAEKPPGAEPGGFLGIVTRVFSSESIPSNLDEQLTVRCR